jgi:hypothetical protein
MEQSRVVRYGDRAGQAYGPKRVEVQNSSVCQRWDKPEDVSQELTSYILKLWKSCIDATVEYLTYVDKNFNQKRLIELPTVWKLKTQHSVYAVCYQALRAVMGVNKSSDANNSLKYALHFNITERDVPHRVLTKLRKNSFSLFKSTWCQFIRYCPQ